MTSTPRSTVERQLPRLCFDPVWILAPATLVADNIGEMQSTAIGGKVRDGVFVPFEAKAGPLRRNHSLGRFVRLGENGAS
jgi:hypothetical protein